MSSLFDPVVYNLQMTLLVIGVAALLGLPFLIFSLSKRFTGRHMLGFAVAMFTVVIVVNVFMAFQASHTFPGLEATNGYVVSQDYDREKADQDRLGWTVDPVYDGQSLVVKITGPDGQPAPVGDLQVTVGRPTHVRDDQTPALEFRDGAWRAPLALAPGAWILHVSAHAPDGTLFRQRINHYHGDRVQG